jgi:hypothetical protein
MDDGTIVDLTAYDEFDVLLTFRMLPSRLPQFLDVLVYDPT